MAVVCKTPRTIISATGFCAGCGHGIINRITAEALEELGVDKKTIMALGVGCCSLMGFNFGVDRIGSPHGRAPAVATGIKRLQPDKVVMTYQGDGDISSIGCAEIVHAAARNEKITTIFVNNGVYGMTGGQMAPTTLPNQVTTTSPKGRDPELTGMPIKITEMIAVLPVAYVARGSVHNPAAIRKAKGYIKQALQAQLNGEGFSMVEILSPCPTNWHLSPLKALERIENEVIPYYPMGELVKGRVRLMHEVLIAGFGGQGVLATGVMLANAGLKADLHSTWLPSYGGEMRGGTANCSVIVSEEQVASPYIDNPDVLVVFNGPSLDKFEAQVKPGGYIFINSSLVKREDVRDDVTVIRVPATELATELGNVRVANVVMLGALLSKFPTISEEAALTSLEEYFEPKGEKVINLNRQALKKGIEVGSAQGESK